MPYIKSNDGRRESLQSGEPALNAGELNYQIFHYIKYNCKNHILCTSDIDKICYLIKQFLGNKPNYQRYNDMTGVLIRCAKEIYRRLGLYFISEFNAILILYDKEIADYEDIKIKENGDV